MIDPIATQPNIPSVVLTPIEQLIPISAAVGIVSGLICAFLLIGAYRWKKQPPQTSAILLMLIVYPLLGALLLMGTTAFAWNADPTRSLLSLRQDWLVLVPLIFVEPLVVVLGDWNIFKQPRLSNSIDDNDR